MSLDHWSDTCPLLVADRYDAPLDTSGLLRVPAGPVNEHEDRPPIIM